MNSKIKIPQCRFCDHPLEQTFVDLGMSPLSNAYLSVDRLQNAEKFYPLHTYVCSNCWLVQLEEFESPAEIFSDYAYFSSYSATWLHHAQEYTEKMIAKFGFDKTSQVIEIASNDGYLLQYFQQQGISVLGIEPAVNVAEVAIKKGISTLIKFFGINTAKELLAQDKQADLLLGNNVLAHVPDLHDFVEGMKIVLKNSGVITMEFPHLLQLIQEQQFDTIYHEHFSYLSLLTVVDIFASHELRIFDVEELSTHGGSLRIYACHQGEDSYQITDRLQLLKQKEIEAGLQKIETYQGFAAQVRDTKRQLLQCLIDLKQQGKTIVGYGAAAKGNTLLNYCGIRGDFLDYVCDRSPHKQGLFLPGTHLPIEPPEKISETKPDYVLILPWNIKAEVMTQLDYIRSWGGKFIIPIPKVEIVGGSER